MAADAHDAVPFGSARLEGWRLMLMMLARLRLRLLGENVWRLMLMMLASLGLLGEKGGS